MKISTFLVLSGWYEGRNLSNELQKTNLFKKFPNSVQIFYQEFVGLKIVVNGLDTLTIDNIDSLNSKSHEKYFEEYKFEITDNLKFELNFDDTYYYSTLIGLQLFNVGLFSDKSQLLVDDRNNFYVITNLGELIWIGVNVIQALNNYYFGGEKYLLNEDKLIWISSVGEKTDFEPPININLSENPW